jgi:predicted ATP-grasp superfamily ATP-dependent carboligase
MLPGANSLGDTACNYFIITNRTPYAERVQAQYPDNVWLVGGGADGAGNAQSESLDTHEILALPEVVQSITKSTVEEHARIVVFKNTKQIEKIASERGWVLLNPSAALAETIENKITQVAWLGELAAYLPAHKIQKIKDVKPEYADKKIVPFIIQWAHSHTGDGTILISDEKELTALREKFPEREARISAFIKGPSFTMNVIAAPTTSTLPHEANISYQITGALPFTENPWSTIGNDWSVTHSILSEKNLAEIQEMTAKISEKMHTAGWRGLFGIDLIYDEERDEIRLIEINARQPASTSFESQLQLGLRIAGVPGVTTFEAHLSALIATPVKSATKKSVGEHSIHINDGAQIIQRVTTTIKALDTKKLEDEGFVTIPYINTKPNTDLLRIQSLRGIMESHNKFNVRGKKIIEIVTQ